MSLDNTPIRNDTVICPKEITLLNITTLNSDLTNIPTWEKQIPTWGFDQVWDLYSTVPIILAVLMFPLLNFKSATFFTKFNSIGKFANFSNISICSFSYLHIFYFRNFKCVIFINLCGNKILYLGH